MNINKKIIAMVLASQILAIPFSSTAAEISNQDNTVFNVADISKQINGDRMYEVLEELSTESRAAGLKKDTETINYIKERLASYGYDTGVQNFDIEASYTDTFPDKVTLNVEGIDTSLWDISGIRNTMNGELKAKLFVYTPKKTTPEDLKDKLVIVSEEDMYMNEEITNSYNSGAKGIIIVGSDEQSPKNGLQQYKNLFGVGLPKTQGEYFVNEVRKNPELTATINIAGAEWSKQTGNVIAIKKPNTKNKTNDILIISGHHDSVKSSYGANDNASGTTILLELAKVLSQVDTDTEIRFVSFGAEELGLKGSKQYVESLSADEKERIIGDIQLDMLASKNGSEPELATVDGKETLVGNLIAQAAKQLGFKELNLIKESRSDHASFAKNRVPAVLMTQDGAEGEMHSFADNKKIIDKEKLTSAAKMIVVALAKVMDSETPSMIQESHNINDYDNYVIDMPTKSVIYFHLDRDFTENSLGLKGIPVEITDQMEKEMNYERYEYIMKWFEYDKAIPTIYIYRNNGLEQIDLQMEKAGISKEEALTILKKALGEPAYEDNQQDAKSLVWTSNYRKIYTFTDKGEHYEVSINDCANGDTVLGEYELKNNDIVFEDKTTKNARLWELAKKIIPPNKRQYINKFIAFTEGLSGKLGYAGPVNVEKDNHNFIYAIDENDVFEEDGNYRDLEKVLQTMVHEFGHILTLNDTQAELGKDGDFKCFFEHAKYNSDSYIFKFYNEFWKDTVEEHRQNASLFYDKYSDWFVTKYASTDMSEDIAESFAKFVLGDKPENEDTIAAKKVLFFYQFDDMVKIRDYIRSNITDLQNN